jgi:hypothetical protein
VAGTAPVIAGEIHRLLRCAGAFDRQGRLGEERRAAPELLHQLPGVGGEVEAIVGGNPILAQGPFEAGDGAPIRLEPRGGDKNAISEPSAVGEDNAVVLRLERLGGDALPSDAFRHDGRHRAHRGVGAEDAASDEGPARLVEVPVRRLHHGDVEPWPPPKQARGGRKTGGTSAYDDHVIALGRCSRTTRGVRRRLPARVEAWFQRIEVIARSARRRQEIRRRNLCWRKSAHRLAERVPVRQKARTGASSSANATLKFAMSSS